MSGRRYWVSSPPALLEGMEGEIDEADEEKLEAVGGALAELGFMEDRDNVQLVFKTRDLEQACEVARAARAAWAITDNPLDGDSVEITAQPECPRCGRLGRFRDPFCASCGVPMLPAEDIDPDTGAVRPRR
ncbi:MAG: hypothetical protein JXB32_03550 [Deltaproteobacteria bacterium]|nr:hypothetical protein [Deltaproteobacteria bacterium]